MTDKEIAVGLREAASELRKLASEDFGETLEKDAGMELDPEMVMDFMLFYGSANHE